jgi:mRNA interferase RelE/StbE
LRKYRVQFTREAKKRIDKLDASIKKIIQKAIDSLSHNPYRGKPLSHELAGLYSFRTSDYRIIYKIEEGQLIIIVITVGHRREIYKKLREWVS